MVHDSSYDFAPKDIITFSEIPVSPKSKQLKQVSSSYKDAWIYKKSFSRGFSFK